MSSLLRHWFAHPMALWLLLALPLRGAFAWRARKQRQRALAQMGSGLAFERMIYRRRGFVSRLRAGCLGFGLILLAVGVAGPQWGLDWTQSAAPGRDLVIVLDLSRSMLAEQPSRLQRAQRALVDLSEVVQKRGGHRLGLVIFAGRARVVCPLTHDYDHFRQMVEKYDANHLDPRVWPREGQSSGTRIGLGVQTATEILDQRFAGAQDILLVSDGDDPAADREWELAILAAQFQKVPVHCVGFGDPDSDHAIPFESERLVHGNNEVTTRLNEEPLEQIAERTKGVYVAARTGDVDLGELFLERISSGVERSDSPDALPVYRQRFVWFLTPAFVFLLASMALSTRRM